MAVGNLSRTSVRDALARGITAEQVGRMSIKHWIWVLYFKILFLGSKKKNKTKRSCELLQSLGICHPSVHNYSTKSFL